jgi:gliding motility-associated-like protein
VSLTGKVANATSGTWSTSGTGTFTPSASNLSTSYIPSAADTAAHSVTLTLQTVGSGICAATQDQLVVTINKKPVVNAGNDISICTDATSVNLNGSVVNATGGTWTTSGTGTFSNATALNAVYTPSNADKIGGTVTLTLTSTGMGTCNAVSDKMFITFTPAPTVNAGPDLTICSDASSVTVTGTVTVASGGTWTTSGSGSFANANAISTTYTPSAADTTAGTVTLTLTTTGNGTCSPYQDPMILTITHKPVVSAGANSTICADSSFVSLAGSVTNAVGGQWSTSGTGTFFPSITNLNANYVPSSADKTSGSVTLTLTSTGNGKCNAVHADRVITITTSPTSNAGADQSVCASVNTINVTGTVSVATGGIWTTSGTGTFASNTSLTTTYTPSANDKASGSVILTLTTTGNGNCKSASDQLTITLNPVPVTNAGPDKTICADLSSLVLNGSVQFASGGVWKTSGTGVFSDTSALNATYFPSAADKSTGNVTLTLTSKGNGTCSAIADNLTLLITPAPTVNTGSDQTICETGSANITATFTVASGGTWTSSGSGTFSPNPNTANATYFPSAADKTDGTVTLTFTTTGNGTCNAVSDDLILTLTPKATVNAGADAAHCADIEFIQLNGSITNTTGATWTTDGSGSFSPDNTSLNAIYTPSATDKSNGVVTLTLTTTAGICSSTASNMKITFSPVPTVSAGPNITACTGIGSVSLNPTVTVATGGVWTTTGTGSFNPDENTLNASYIPSAADQAAGSVLLILATTGNGACNQQTDTVAVDFSPVPSIEAGPAQTVCETDLPVQLAGSGTTGVWSGGAGTFSPNANTLNAMYQPTAAEIASGSVTLTLTTTGIGSCTPGVDNVTITIKAGGPSVNAGTDIQACTNATNIPLAGIFNGAAGVVWTTASGTGTFSSTTDPNATFTPSALQLNAGVAHLTLTTTGNNGCNAKSDQVDIILGPAPTADAGFDQNVCSSAGSVQLNGSKTVATGVTWTVVTGNGTFNNATSLTPIYTIDPADIGLGSIKLRMTTTGNGNNCNPVQDDVVITFTGAPTSNAGANSSHCADVTSIALNGTSSTSAGVWSTTGSGTFSPSTTNLNASYIPSASDKSTGVTLTLTTSGNGVCAAGTSTRTLSFTAPPTVTAGADQQFCSDQPSTNLTATFNHAGGISWSSSGTGSFGSTTSANTVYTPSVQDIANGGVNLTITTTGSAPCAEVQDFMTISILPAPTSQVNAGFDQSVCKDVTSVHLDGAVTIALGGKWTTSGSGSFSPNDSTLNASYVPSAADKSTGNVTLTLTTIHNGICNPGSDDMKITFTPSTTAAIAAIPNPCEDVNTVSISGSFTVAAGIVWSTAGTGSFAPNEFTANATYVPSAQDKANGNVGLTLTTTGNGTCNATSATRSITFTKKPTVNAGSDKTVCSDIASVGITATISSTTGVSWTSSGTGTFTPSNSSVTSYTPSAADFAATRVNLKLTANGIGSCTSSNDVVTIDFTPAPTVQAGVAQTICADLSGLTLTPKVTVATGGLWSTSGSGTFIPSASTLNATYQPSQSDKQNGSVNLTLTTTGNGTCKAVSSQKAVTISPQPIVSSGPAVICSDLQGAQLSGSVTNATGGIWTSTGTGTFSPSATNLNAIYYPSQSDMGAGSVTLKLTSTGNGTCNPVSSTSKLLVGPLPIADAGNDQYVCQNSSITLVAKPSSDVKYNWEDNSGASLATTESITIPVPSNSFVVLTVTDARGCMTTDTVRLTTYNLPTLTLPAHACLTDSLVLDAQPTNMPVVPGTFQWYNGNTILSGENDFTLVVKKPGDNTIKWSYGSCVVSASTNVTMPPKLLTVDTITACTGQLANLTTTSTPATGLTFIWTTGGSNVGNTQTITTTSSSGISTYNVKATDAVGCIAIDSIKLNGIPVPTFNIKDTTNCQGKTIVLHATPTNVPGYQSMNPIYQWKENGNVLPQTSDSLSASSAGLYTVMLTLDQCVGKDTANIILNPNPTDGMASTTRYCNDTQDSITLNAGSGTGYTYIWTNSTGTILGINQLQTVYDPGKYFVQIKNTLNCILNDSIQVNDVCKPRVDPPTAFTPDGKGPTENEQWALFARYVTNFKLTIFNRWGEIIFYTEDPNQSWDGTYRGEPMPVGVYPYLITYEGLADEYKGPYKKEGSVTIVK